MSEPVHPDPSYPETPSSPDASGGVWSYQFDEQGRLQTSVAPDGSVTTYTWDEPLQVDLNPPAGPPQEAGEG